MQPVIGKILNEQNQNHETRKQLIVKLEKTLGRPVVCLFTSFNYKVVLDDSDADVLEGILQTLDLKDGLALLINSPGGSGLAAEKIINICRNYSGTNEYWAIVAGRAKSAATMVCFGASKVMMGTVSELGPIDPQMSIIEDGRAKRFSLVNIVDSYNNLFREAIKTKTGNLQPYLQQLSRYDAREIKEFEDAIELSKDIAVTALNTGMLKHMTHQQIEKEIKMFLSPQLTKTHGRAIDSITAKNCGLNVKDISPKDKLWKIIYELYSRQNSFVTRQVAKCVESKDASFVTGIPEQDRIKNS